jgi:hypothetical protein
MIFAAWIACPIAINAISLASRSMSCTVHRSPTASESTGTDPVSRAWGTDLGSFFAFPPFVLQTVADLLAVIPRPRQNAPSANVSEFRCIDGSIFRPSSFSGRSLRQRRPDHVIFFCAG